VSRPYRPAPPPLEGNDVIITVAGTAAWAVALIVLFLLRSQLPSSSHWWIWTCLAGFGLGLFALIYVPRLKRSRARAAARRSADAETAAGAGTGTADIAGQGSATAARDRASRERSPGESPPS
jgi:hypothetical protein